MPFVLTSARSPPSGSPALCSSEDALAGSPTFNVTASAIPVLSLEVGVKETGEGGRGVTDPSVIPTGNVAWLGVGGNEPGRADLEEGVAAPGSSDGVVGGSGIDLGEVTESIGGLEEVFPAAGKIEAGSSESIVDGSIRGADLFILASSISVRSRPLNSDVGSGRASR
jgi:hypothetical protein